MRVHRRRFDAKELLVSRVDAVRPDDTQVQLVVLRGLQVFRKVVRQQHSSIEELSADEGADVLLVVLGRALHRRLRGGRHRGRVARVRRPAQAGRGRTEARRSLRGRLVRRVDRHRSGRLSGVIRTDQLLGLHHRSLRQRVVPEMIRSALNAFARVRIIQFAFIV